MNTASRMLVCSMAVALLAGCASRSHQVKPNAADPAQYAKFDCPQLDEELDRVQQRAAVVAYAVDERAGNNIIALGMGVTVFWPALLAMRADGPEAAELARLRGQHDALRATALSKRCEAVGAGIPAARLAQFSVSLGERLVYEERQGVRGPLRELGLRLHALRRDELEFFIEPGAGYEVQRWRQDRAGNLVAAPPAYLRWSQLLRAGMGLGDVVSGSLSLPEDDSLYARVRGQVVAVGPQQVAGRRFDVAVVELFGDARHAEHNARINGVIVIDRMSGTLLRLDLRSSLPELNLQRRLVRVEAARP